MSDTSNTPEASGQTQERREKVAEALAETKFPDDPGSSALAFDVAIDAMEAEADHATQQHEVLVGAATAWAEMYKVNGDHDPATGTGEFADCDPCVCEKCALYRLVLSLQNKDAGALHLVWNGVEWVDDRCGCRYHPDDQNMSHGGAPHVHQCEKHKAMSEDRSKSPKGSL